MYKNIKLHSRNTIVWVLNIVMVLGIFGLGSCSKMDDTYHKFWDEGEHIYPASPDSLKSFSGKDRVELQWLVVGDPTIRKAVIYWNNRTDSMVVPIDKENSDGIDTMNVFIDHLQEGTYSFEVFTFDQYGNRSVEANAVGKVYGDSYAESLLPRLVDNNSYVDDVLTIHWSDPADAASIGVEIEYTGTDGDKQTRHVLPNADTTIINNFGFSYSKYFKYRTLFLPDTTAIDTFYTAYDSVRVLGPRTNLSNAGWTATASSYDERHGTDRLPRAAFDDDINSAWVNKISTQTYYPHTLTIDMGSVHTDIYGISIVTNGRNENPTAMNVYISDDNVNWQPLGLITLEKIRKVWQYHDFSEPMAFRYFRMVFEDSYGSDNIIIYEAGVYTR